MPATACLPVTFVDDIDDRYKVEAVEFDVWRPPAQFDK